MPALRMSRLHTAALLLNVIRICKGRMELSSCEYQQRTRRYSIKGVWTVYQEEQQGLNLHMCEPIQVIITLAIRKAWSVLQGYLGWLYKNMGQTLQHFKITSWLLLQFLYSKSWAGTLQRKVFTNKSRQPQLEFDASWFFQKCQGHDRFAGENNDITGDWTIWKRPASYMFVCWSSCSAVGNMAAFFIWIC
jgi:hypothetical protein